MSSNGVHDAFTPSHVLAAVRTMRTGEKETKTKAHEYLERFQKSKDSWATIMGILQSTAEPEATLFAAITLRGKITYDLTTQVSPNELPALRSQLLLLLKHFAAGPKPIRVQLCVCLAILAIQMKDWNDVLSSVVQSLGDSPEKLPCLKKNLRHGHRCYWETTLTRWYSC